MTSTAALTPTLVLGVVVVVGDGANGLSMRVFGRLLTLKKASSNHEPTNKHQKKARAVFSLHAS